MDSLIRISAKLVAANDDNTSVFYPRGRPLRVFLSRGFLAVAIIHKLARTVSKGDPRSGMRLRRQTESSLVQPYKRLKQLVLNIHPCACFLIENDL